MPYGAAAPDQRLMLMMVTWNQNHLSLPLAGGRMYVFFSSFLGRKGLSQEECSRESI